MGSIECEINHNKRKLNEEESEYEISEEEPSEISLQYRFHENTSREIESESEIGSDQDDNEDSELADSSDDISEVIIQPPSTQSNRLFLKYSVLIIISIVVLGIFLEIFGYEASKSQDETQKQSLKINIEYIDGLNKRYPGLLTQLDLRVIKSRLAVMQDEVSILMLLGKAKDSHCKLDRTFCVGQTIANITQYEYSYLDASDPYLGSEKIDKELGGALDGDRYTIMIDSLEKLPASEVMNLFQYIDKDETNRRRGMILFIVYTGSEYDLHNPKLKKADIAEKILTQRWSMSISTDTLTSVISRMCGSIIKVH